MRVGTVYLMPRSVVVVVSGPGPTRHPGSTLSPEAEADATGQWPSDRQVYTLAVLLDSGVVKYPVERLEDTLIRWEQDGVPTLPPSSV